MRLAVHVEAHLALGAHGRDHRVRDRLTETEVQVRRVRTSAARVHRHEATLVGGLTVDHRHVQRHRTDGRSRGGQSTLVQHRELQRGSVAATVTDLGRTHTTDVLTRVEHARRSQGGEGGGRRRERHHEQVDVGAATAGATNVAGARSNQHHALTSGRVVVQVGQRAVRVGRVTGGVRRDQLGRAQHRVVQVHVEAVVAVVGRDEVVVGLVGDEAAVGRDPRSGGRGGRLTRGDLAHQTDHRARAAVVPQVHAFGRTGVAGQQVEAGVGLERDAIAIGGNRWRVLRVDQRRRGWCSVRLHAGVGHIGHRRSTHLADHQSTHGSRRADHVDGVGHESHLRSVSIECRQVTAAFGATGGERAHPHRGCRDASERVHVHVGAEVQVVHVEVLVRHERDLGAVTAEPRRVGTVAGRDVLLEIRVVRNAHHADRHGVGRSELVEDAVGIRVTVDHVHVRRAVRIGDVELVLGHVRHPAPGGADLRVVAVQTGSAFGAVRGDAESRDRGAVGDEHVDGTVGVTGDQVARQRLEDRPANATGRQRGGHTAGITDAGLAHTTVGISATGVQNQSCGGGQRGRRSGCGPHRTRPERTHEAGHHEITETLLHQSSFRLMIELMGQRALFRRQ